MAKQYATVDIYEKKLKRVMERLGVKDQNYDWNRTSSWIEFKHKGDVYRFDHSIENAKAHGINLRCGSESSGYGGDHRRVYENQADSRRSKRIFQRKEYLNNHPTEAKAL